MSWCIYKHTNKINGKVYIGQTCQNPKDRWQNGKGYENNIYFYNAIKKYGWQDGFTHEIIEDNIETQELANEREIYYIEFYNSYEDGYNLTKGGNNAEHRGDKIYQIDMVTLKVIAEYPTTRHASRAVDGDHTLIAKVCKREITNERYNISAYGYYWCYVADYTSNWSPLIRRESHSSGEEIYQLEERNGDYVVVNCYPSILNASELLKLSHSAIWSCCNNGNYITCGGFYWCYAKDYTPNWKPRENKSEKQKRRVRRIEDNMIFNSIAEAARASGIKCPETITRCCQGKQKTAGGYHWEYVD
jgi:group I intron endonuclease